MFNNSQFVLHNLISIENNNFGLNYLFVVAKKLLLKIYRVCHFQELTVQYAYLEKTKVFTESFVLPDAKKNNSVIANN